LDDFKKLRTSVSFQIQIFTTLSFCKKLLHERCFQSLHKSNL
jgi:hypothetical protein